MDGDRPSFRWLLWFALALAVWSVPAALGATQQWVQLRETPKHIGWLATFLYQAPSWYALVPMTPMVVIATRRWPLRGEQLGARIAAHLGVSLLFGVLFVVVSVPVRNALHPAPVQWELFGPPFYKSAPQFAAVGVLAYLLLVLAGSLIESTRHAAALSVELEGRGPEPVRRIVVETPCGKAVLSPTEIRWAEPNGRGTLLRTDADTVRTRHTMADLEGLLAPLGFARVHRSRLVNVARVREVAGGAGRDGQLTLDSGDRVPVSRRRRDELDALLPTAPLS